MATFTKKGTKAAEIPEVVQSLITQDQVSALCDDSVDKTQQAEEVKARKTKLVADVFNGAGKGTKGKAALQLLANRVAAWRDARCIDGKDIPEAEWTAEPGGLNSRYNSEVEYWRRLFKAHGYTFTSNRPKRGAVIMGKAHYAYEVVPYKADSKGSGVKKGKAAPTEDREDVKIGDDDTQVTANLSDLSGWLNLAFRKHTRPVVLAKVLRLCGATDIHAEAVAKMMEAEAATACESLYRQLVVAKARKAHGANGPELPQKTA